MWLVTAVGSVNGQTKFTFVLEQKKVYTVGKDKACDIRLVGRYIRPIEGRLEVGDWDPTNRTKPPSLSWKPEPKKNGSISKYNTIFPLDHHLLGSTDKADYHVEGIETGETSNAHGVWFDNEVNHGQGIDLGEEGWFFTVWEDLLISYDKMGKESDETRDALRRSCISYTASLEKDNLPNVVLSDKYKSNHDCNYAVCYGIPISTPNYLISLIQRLSACWKKVADHQDSFVRPDYLDEAFQPGLNTGLPNLRMAADAWKPDERRKRLFKGWEVFALKNNSGDPLEKRWLDAMGASYADKDVVTQPLLSADHFESVLKDWLQVVDRGVGRDKALVMYVGKTKDDLGKAGVNFASVVQATCQRLGVICASGLAVWGAVKCGGVENYFEELGGRRPTATAQPVIQITEAAPSAPPSDTITHDPPSSALMPPPVQPGPSRRSRGTAANTTQVETNVTQANGTASFIPATYPDETYGATKSTEVDREKTPELSQGAVRKPLKRRGAAKPVDLFQDDEFEMMASVNPEPSQPAVSQRARGRVESQMETPAASQTMEVDAPQSSMAPTRKRPTRRTQPESQSANFNMFDTSFDGVNDDDRETPADIRELYEQTKASTSLRSQNTRRRGRSAGVESLLPPIDDESQESVISPASLPKVQEEVMDIEPVHNGMIDGEGDDEDVVQQILKRGRKNRMEGRTDSAILMPPPAQIPTRRGRSPSESTEVLDTRAKTKPKPNPPASPIKKPTKPGATATKPPPSTSQNEPTKDEAFLQAITKASKTKKAVDELDKEFNQLRIPKPVNGVREEEIPDWGLVNDFEGDLRGNFIQIVRRDLYRKDGGGKAVERVDDGRPNFKKFKKKNIVRREPVQMVLAGPTSHDAEMGEPYWPQTEVGRGKKGQSSQMPIAYADEEEDTMPLLPRSRKRLLGGTPDVEESFSTASKQRGIFSQTKASTPAIRAPTQRRTRGTTVDSDVSIASAPAPTATAGRKATRGKVKEKDVNPIVIDEEDEDEVDVGLIGSRMTGTGKSGTAGAKNSGKSGANSTTLDGETTRSRGRGTQSVMPTSTGTTGRRRLLLADDDDDTVAFKPSVAKKRRLG